MRPRSKDRGELTRQCSCSTTACCFNAATVRKPWKTSTTTTGSATRSRFNAATVRKPWRFFQKFSQGQLLPMLQCGRGPKTVENPRPGEHATDGTVASMRPRSENRGERTYLLFDPANPVASMRPRSENPGEHSGNGLTVLGADALQCGHGPKTVENTTNPFYGIKWGWMLQCGHGVTAVENQGVLAGQLPGLRASMRSRSKDRGEHPVVTHDLMKALASMRPRAKHRGELWAMRPCDIARTGLQCGHGRKTVENPTRPRPMLIR